MLVPGRGTDPETTAGLQARPPCVRRGDLMASAILLGLLGTPWLPGEPGKVCGQGRVLLHPSKSKFLSGGPRPSPLLRLW